jgi:hypothetical protein
VVRRRFSAVPEEETQALTNRSFSTYQDDFHPLEEKMKKLFSSALALAIVAAMAVSAQAQTFNKTTIFGNGNYVNIVNSGWGYGGVYNDTFINGNFNQVNNINQGYFGGPVYNSNAIYGSYNGINNVNMAGPYGFSPYGGVYNQNTIFGHFNSINNINGGW